jgi:uncharacterized lipoprotein YbaY
LEGGVRENEKMMFIDERRREVEKKKRRSQEEFSCLFRVQEDAKNVQAFDKG